ncbi:proline-specific permease ProY, partial [Xanthomonas citri pv. citri]|nr:proline-specific permease ProY [Xanthomonas citri pv. citri]
FTHTNRGGVPWLSVAVMLGVMVLGAVLITVDPNAFSLVASVASFAVVLTWAMIFLSHRAMRRRVAEQGAEPSPFPMPLGD